MSLDLLQLEQNIEEGDELFDDHEDDDEVNNLNSILFYFILRIYPS